MKKLILPGIFLTAVAVMSMMFISSCKKDANGILSPTVTFKAATGSISYVSNDITLDSGTAVIVGVTAFSNTTSSTKLEEVTLTITFDNAVIKTFDTTIKASSYDEDYNFKVTWVGNARILATVTDKDGQVADVAFNITGKKPTTIVNLSSYPNLNMGGSLSSHGSYLDAETGTVYLVADVTGSTSIKDAIDIIFDNGKLTSTATIITSTGTHFSTTTLTGTEFNGITTNATFGSYSATLTERAISVGDIVFFQTVGGKRGLVKVNSMTPPNGDLNVSVKIEP